MLVLSTQLIHILYFTKMQNFLKVLRKETLTSGYLRIGILKKDRTFGSSKVRRNAYHGQLEKSNLICLNCTLLKTADWI